ADGSVFAAIATQSIPSGPHTYVIDGGRVNVYYKHKTSSVLIPGPDGRVVYASGGPRTNQLEPVGGTPEESGFVGSIPAQNGPFYITPEGMPAYYIGPYPAFPDAKQRQNPALSLHFEGVDKPLLTLTDLEGYEIPKKLDISGVAD